MKGLDNARITHRGRLLGLAEFTPPGAPHPYEIAVRSPGVRVIGFSPDKQTVWLTNEYRHEIEGRDYRLPGGKVVDSLDEYLRLSDDGFRMPEEAILEAAKKEFREEVGLELGSPTVMSTSPCGSSILWDLYFVVGEVEGVNPRQQLEDGEDIKPEAVAIDRAVQLALYEMGEERSAMRLFRILDDMRRNSVDVA